MKLYSSAWNCLLVLCGFMVKFWFGFFFSEFFKLSSKILKGSLPKIHVTDLFICEKESQTAEHTGLWKRALLCCWQLVYFSLAKWCFLLMLQYSNQKHLIQLIKNSLLGFADQMNRISKTFQVGNFLQILIFVDLKLKVWYVKLHIKCREILFLGASNWDPLLMCGRRGFIL